MSLGMKLAVIGATMDALPGWITATRVETSAPQYR
jgi:hypothetical protein